MKKNILAALSLLLLSPLVSAAELRTYEEIANAAMHGKEIKIVVSFDSCRGGNRALFNHSRCAGSFKPDSFMFDDTPSMAASLTHFTRSNPMFPEESIFEHVRYTINPDNTLTLSAIALDAATYEAISGKFEIVCEFAKAVHFYS